MQDRDYDVIVIGGGFYGSTLAAHAAEVFRLRTVLIERETCLLGRASYGNQARVHRGYHYPRSLLTAYRSQANFDRFVAEFRDCVDTAFDSFYAVSGIFSNVTASQFSRFCERIGAPIRRAPADVRRLFDLRLVEDVFEVQEAVFDARKMRERLSGRLQSCGAVVRLASEALEIRRLSNQSLEVRLRTNGDCETLTARNVFDCTYSRLNHLLVESGIEPIALQHELAEIALVRVPEPLEGMGVTVMCGPFFSILPFPPRGLHSLSHVRYTPHYGWEDGDAESYREPNSRLDSLQKRTRYVEMIKDAERFLPLLSETTYVDSIWETKTLLPRSEVDDGRPILFKRDHGLAGLHCVIGSKIDNVYDVMDSATRVLVETQ